ncbi:MAG TPA: Sec-independent protein translocase protein TatB [Pseudomonadales bacterium]|jgi:sec-independent protein translocase protein TatB|nr:twin-arginine translocase subunit TatB [Gammaproteobacteria bacterium]MDP6027868.1 Sec-independent protein translocase protein TatB [Pseudomonadales bacterium]MDP6316173.1 Sec-independent protein translocase protein TatB [Pseudomonadales bacterium]MDP7315643.1 Sec-independent protein translocase protein TatB [Pseudomonadales bacterium]HJL60545.1 Sec-independent protein translocase protein TatB [Pseudomonadales bacterium]|tara:strand:+ start:385 stop:771 length:387 start_codon:yes stop_codon:yes gene_type:complete
MFDIGFTEILLVMSAALLVIGPKQLPETIRVFARWVARIKKLANELKSELENEIGVEEIKTQLRNETILTDFEKDKQALQVLDEEIKDTRLDFMNAYSFSEEKGNQNSNQNPTQNPDNDADELTTQRS